MSRGSAVAANWASRIGVKSVGQALTTALAILLSSTSTASAQPSPNRDGDASGYVGNWAISVDGRYAVVVHLQASGGGRFSGSAAFPSHFGFDPGGGTLFGLSGPAKTKRLSGALQDGHLVLTLTEGLESAAHDAQRIDIYRDRAGILSMKFPGVTMNGLPLVAAPADAAVAPDFDEARNYAINIERPSNPALKIIADADQAERADDKLPVEILRAHDDARRAQLLRIIEGGGLGSGVDYERAAYILQHSLIVDDYLLAHSLALVAIKKGQTGAIVIATQTLDRYLQRSGRAQIYGTQFRVDPTTHAWTQAPYETTTIPDSIRTELGIATLDVQRQQLEDLASQTPPTK